MRSWVVKRPFRIRRLGKNPKTSFVAHPDLPSIDDFLKSRVKDCMMSFEEGDVFFYHPIPSWIKREHEPLQKVTRGCWANLVAGGFVVPFDPRTPSIDVKLDVSGCVEEFQ